MPDEIPYANGYNHLRGLFVHLPIKDVRRGWAGNLEWASVGGRFIDRTGQFEVPRRDHLEGGMALEFIAGVLMATK